MKSLIKAAIKKIAVSLLPFFACSVSAQNIPFSIVIHSSNPWPNTMAFLSYTKPGQQLPGIDSVKLINGQAILKGMTPGIQKAKLYLERANKGFVPNNTKASREIYLERGTLLFKTSRDVTSARLSGAPLNEDLQGYLDVLLRYKPVQDSLSNLYGAARRNSSMEDLGRLTAEFKVLDSLKRHAELEHLSKKPSSIVSLEWLKQNVNIAQQKVLAQMLFSRFDERLKKSPAGREYARMLKNTASVSIGGMAPNFNARTIDDKDVSLASFKGKYVLLDFWASWCAPCRAENPNVLKAYKAFKDSNFTVLGFSMDTSKPSWKHAVLADNMPWTQISDLLAWEGSVSKLYGIAGIPANFLIDPSGKIIARDLRGEQLEQALNKILK